MDLRETPLAAHYAYEGKIINLRVDDARLPNGTVAKREVVEHPGGVGVLALTDEGEVLLVQQYRYPYGEITLEIPAGKRDRGEQPLETGKRELAEETGASAERFVSLGVLYPTPGYCDEVIHLYLATGLHFAEMNPDEDEFLAVQRLPLHTLVERVMAGEIPDAKTQIAALKAWKLTEDGQI
jgi:ADP-ribose pyrophosphatase